MAAGGLSVAPLGHNSHRRRDDHRSDVPLWSARNGTWCTRRYPLFSPFPSLDMVLNPSVLHRQAQRARRGIESPPGNTSPDRDKVRTSYWTQVGTQVFMRMPRLLQGEVP